MASKFAEDVLCSVCLETCGDPLILTCSHTFCQDCLQKFWEIKGNEECPVCRRQSSKDFLPTLAVKNQSAKQTEEFCKEHNRKLKLFCQDDKQLVCLKCRDSELHKHHKFSPAGEATVEKKKMADLHALSDEPPFAREGERREVDWLDNVVLNIAVTGESGAGKSSFVNAIRGLTDTDEGAAPVGEVETTMEPNAYPHPTVPNVKIWDLPGVGTKRFDASSYAKKMKFKTYDFFIIVSATRFKENDIKLAKEIKKKKKNFYFVRLKTDIDVANAERRGVTEVDILQTIQESCVRNLTELGPPPVFLITSHHLNRFDFPKLIDTLERDIPVEKKDALILSVPIYSHQCLQKKYVMFKKTVWTLTALSGGIGATPLPGLSTVCDIAIITTFVNKVYFSFGLDEKSLKKLGKRVDKPILEIFRESKIIQERKKAVLSKSLIAKIGMAAPVEAFIILPVLGNVAAAGVTSSMTSIMLLNALRVLYTVAKEVIDMAGL